MTIYKVKNYDEMSKKAADIVAAQVVLKPECVLGLATGSTPEGMYAELAKKCDNKDVDFSKVKSANLDEYVGIDRTNDQSYYYYMNKHLFSKINIDKANTNIPDGMTNDPEAECANYDKKIADMGGVDLQVLGMGLNGHIGFNEPDTYFPKGTHCVKLTQSTIDANARFFASIDDVPKSAYTMGIGTIMSAKKILLLVNGAKKAEILKAALTGPITPDVPASILQLHNDVIVVADEEALSAM